MTEAARPEAEISPSTAGALVAIALVSCALLLCWNDKARSDVGAYLIEHIGNPSDAVKTLGAELLTVVRARLLEE